MRAADAGGFLVVAGDDPDALVEFGADALGGADFEKGDAVPAAGAKHLVARLLHLRRVGIARHLPIAEREAQIARPQLGKADPRHRQDLLAAGDPFRAFQLDAEQQFALGIERPGIAAVAVFRLGNAPDRRRGRFRAAPARADPEPFLGRAMRDTFAAQPGQGRGQRRIGAFEVMRVAAAFDKGAHRADRLGLAQEHAMYAAAEDLPELPGIEAEIRLVDAVDRRLDNDRRGAVAGAGWSAFDQAPHVFAKPGHVEGAMLHADVDVVGPGAGIFAALRSRQHMAGMGADVIDRLVLRQEFDRSVDPARHDPGLLLFSPRNASIPQPLPSPASGGG